MGINKALLFLLLLLPGYMQAQPGISHVSQDSCANIQIDKTGNAYRVEKGEIICGDAEKSDAVFTRQWVNHSLDAVNVKTSGTGYSVTEYTLLHAPDINAYTGSLKIYETKFARTNAPVDSLLTALSATPYLHRILATEAPYRCYYFTCSKDKLILVLEYGFERKTFTEDFTLEDLISCFSSKWCVTYR